MKLTKYIIIFSLLSIYIGTNAQQDTIKDGYNIFYYRIGKISSEGMMKNGKPDGYWKTYYMTGVLKSEGNRKNHLLDSTWIFYNNVGDTVKKINYILGKKTGYMLSYNTDRNADLEYIGNIVSRELYINDKKEGTSYYFYKNGKLKSKVDYRNNQSNGIALEYDESGKIITILNYNKGTLVEREKINRIDENGLKQGTWKDFYSDNKVKREANYTNNILDGLYKEYDESGNLTLLLRYRDGKIIEDDNIDAEDIDIRNEYDNDGNLTYSGAFRNTKPIGIHRRYDINGNVINSYIYNDKGLRISEGIVDKEGNKIGQWKNYYNTGELKSTGKYQNNLQEGKWTFYFRDGRIEQEGEFKNGLISGKWAWYYEDGKVEREEEFYNGKEEGFIVEYDEFGEIITKGEYFDGEKEGEWYYKAGDHTEIGSYVAGLRDGKWKYFYDNDQLEYEGNYIQGNPDGKHKYYHENGLLKEEQYFAMGIKEKHWKKYDKYGNLLITISYEDNREVRINGVKIELPDNKVKLIK
jgi:antitoxin component YwqK of YwqJK toxin-antitoxin module